MAHPMVRHLFGKRRPTPLTDKEITQLLAYDPADVSQTTCTVREMADPFGLNPQRIQGFLHARGIQPTRKERPYRYLADTVLQICVEVQERDKGKKSAKSKAATRNSAKGHPENGRTVRIGDKGGSGQARRKVAGTVPAPPGLGRSLCVVRGLEART